jgi:hypothetical protein
MQDGRGNLTGRDLQAPILPTIAVSRSLVIAVISLGLSCTAGLADVLWSSGGPETPGPARKDIGKQPPGSLTLTNESRNATALSPADFAKLSRQTARVKDRSGALVTYEGVSLAAALRAAKVSLGKDLKGPLLANCLLVEAADGYRVTFSLPEVDPDMTDNLVLIADQKDGRPLDAKEGPYRLVVPHDKKHARWVRQVTRISVQATAEISPRTRDK